MSPKTRRRIGLTLEISTPLLFLVIIGIWSTDAGGFFFPPLVEVFRSFSDTWLFARAGSDLLPSLLRLTVGYLIGVAAGLLIGIPLGLSETLRRITLPVAEFLRAIPSPAIIPAAIVILGIGDDMRVLIIALVCAFPVLLNTIDGIRSIDAVLLDTARVYKIQRWELLRGVTLPGALPQIVAGMRTSLAIAIIMMVVSEMIASTNGLGYFIIQSQRSFAIPEMWSGMILLGVLGYSLNALFGLWERRVLAWHRGARQLEL